MDLPIPLNGHTPMVKVGDTVTAGQPLAKKESAFEQVINLATALGVSPRKIPQYLQKNPGDTILVGDVIAKKKGLLTGGAKIVSKLSGIVLRFERDTGELILREQGEKGIEELLSPIEGTIALCNNEKIVIETKHETMLGREGIGITVEGILYFLPNKEHVDLFDLTPLCIDTIVVGTVFSREVLTKAIGIGVKGIIATKIEKETLDGLQAKLNTTPIIIINEADMPLIKKWQKKTILMDGGTRTIIVAA